MATRATSPRHAAGVTHVKHLTPDPKNPRKHSARNLRQIADSLRSLGAARSIVIDEGGRILAGNGTVEAAAKAGITKVHVVDTDGQTIVAVRRRGLSAKQKAELAVRDNRTAELAEWDTSVLASMADDGVDLNQMWSKCELAALRKDAHASTTAADELAPSKSTSITRGQLFSLGKHRLLCGDCTDARDVATLLGDATPGLIHTDPPYGIAYENESLHPNAGPVRARVANDDLHSEQLEAFLKQCFTIAKRHAAANAAWYIWHAALNQAFFVAAALKSIDVVLHRQIIWDKKVLVFGRGQFHWQHEPCYFGWVRGHEPPDYGLANDERTQTTMWRVPGVTTAERRELLHSTPKPVGLFTLPICKHLKSDRGGACYEPFAGSGPQFIAAEMRGVSCLGIELEPRFCQTIIDRWEKFTGQRAVKLGEVRPKRKER